MSALDSAGSRDAADAASSVPPLPLSLNIKLSLMMFLQYAIWGAWLPLFFSFVTEHRGLSQEKAGTLFSIAALGALLAPFFAGQIADRFLNTEKFLGLSHLIGAPLVYGLGVTESYHGLIALGVLYSLVFAPTLALTNSLAFHHLPDRDRDFSRVRIWGTIGWIAAGIGMGQYLYHFYTPAADGAAVRAMHVAGMADCFTLSAILSLILGFYCLFFLPATPPQRGASKFAAGEALGEIRHQPLLALFLIAFPVSIIHQYFYVQTAGFLGHLGGDSAAYWEQAINRIFGVGGGGLMTLGQISELAVLGCMPLLANRLSRKTLLAIGLAAYCARFALFAYTPTLPLVSLGLLMHGLCFGCFYFIAFMVVDENTSSDMRAGAQSLFNFLEVGMGTILGNYFAGKMGDLCKLSNGQIDYRQLFSVPMWIGVGCLVAHLLFYPGGRRGGRPVGRQN